MCNELEQVGLKDPVYHTNAFLCCKRLFIIQKLEKLLLKKLLIH